MSTVPLIRRVIITSGFALLLFNSACNLRIPTSRGPSALNSGSAALSISDAPSYAFTTTAVGGTSATKTFTVTNSGDGTASAISSSVVGPDMRLTSGSCGTELAPSSACTLDVVFSPQSSGSKTDTLTIAYSGGTSSSATLGLTGTALTAAALTITDITTNSFGTVIVGASADRSFTVTNSGQTAATDLAGSFATGADYAFVDGTYPGTGGTCGTTLAAFSTCTLAVRFLPTGIAAASTPELKSDTVQVGYNTGAASTSATRTISGTANAAALLDITDVTTNDFGTVNVGASSSRTFTVTNVGGSAASVMSGSLAAGVHYLFPGGYPGAGIGGTCGAALTTTGSCILGVRFTPQSGGTKSDTIVMSYNDGAISNSSSHGITGQGNAVGGGFDSGELDTSFYTSGRRYLLAPAVAAQVFKGIDFYADGKVALIGNSVTTGDGLAITATRLNTDGSLDSSFYTGGVRNIVSPADAAGGMDVVVDSSGKYVGSGQNGLGYAFVTRILSDATIETTFGIGGFRSYIPSRALNGPGGRSEDRSSIGNAPNHVAMGLALDTSGKILTANWVNNNNGFTDPVIVGRLSSMGGVDTSFHTDGYAAATFSNIKNYATKVLIQTDGFIMASGYSAGALGMVLVRIRSGNFDTSFHTDGKVTDTMSNTMVNLIQDTTGNYVGVAARTFGGAKHFAIARYRNDGVVDTSFSTDGKQSTNFGSALDTAVKVMLGTLNTYYVAGTVNAVDFGIARYLSDGNLDSSFATQGYRVTDLNGTDAAFAAQINYNQPRICIAGSSTTYDDYSIACYIP